MYPLNMQRWSRKLAEAHLRELGAQHDIDISWFKGDWRDSEARYVGRSVKIQHPYTPRTYLAALHEFGHLLSPFAKRYWNTPSPEMHMAVEAVAWHWALANSHPQLLKRCYDEVWVLAEYGLLSHATQLVRKKRCLLD